MSHSHRNVQTAKPLAPEVLSRTDQTYLGASVESATLLLSNISLHG